MAELYQLGPVPAPKKTASANLTELNLHPELYFEVSHPHIFGEAQLGSSEPDQLSGVLTPLQGADIVMMLTASALVFLMIPGIALVYSGAADRHSAITMARMPLITTAFVGIQWYLWGYALTFSPSTRMNDDATFSWLGGDIGASAFRDVMVRPVGIRSSGAEPVVGPQIPELVYALYQGMFACFTASIVAGGAIRKARIGRFLIFISIWSIVVYSPIARWTWHDQGWSRQRGAMDFAGGTAVHVCSGATVAAYCIFFQLEVRGWRVKNLWNSSWRKNREERMRIKAREGRIPLDRTNPDEPFDTTNSEIVVDGPPPRPSNSNAISEGPSSHTTGSRATAEGQFSRTTDPATVVRDQIPTAKNVNIDLEIQHLDASENHSVTNVVLGTTLLWFGWFGFNGGSAQGANLRAVSAVLATHVAACAGGAVGLLLEWTFALPTRYLQKNPSKATTSVMGFCDGAISGLVAITPASGFVPVKVASIFGVVAALVCKLLRFYVRRRLLPYDILDICALHAGGGFIGMLLTAAFADDVVTGLDGYSRIISRTAGQKVRNQLLDVTVGFFYSFGATFAILLLMKLVSRIFRPIVRFGKEKLRGRIDESSSDYMRNDTAKQSVEGSQRLKVFPDHSYRAGFIADKLVALGQHSFSAKQNEGFRNSSVA